MKITRKKIRNIIKESINRHIVQEVFPMVAAAGSLVAGELAYLSLGLVFAEIYNLRENDLNDDKKIQALIDLAQQYDNTKDIKEKKIIELYNFAKECDESDNKHVIYLNDLCE